MAARPADRRVRAGRLEDLQGHPCTTVRLNNHNIVLFASAGRVYALDNRCPHMGFPLDRGDVTDGILTCPWHHARFDLASGGTFDPWADDVRTFPVEIRDGDVWLDLAPAADPRTHQRDRLRVGLERDIALVVAKAVIGLSDGRGDPVEPFRIGLEFGARYRDTGWGQGLTMQTCFMNLLPWLDGADRARALYHGLSAVARDTAGHPPRFPIRPLPDATTDIPTLQRWLRRFVDVRDAEGAERCVVSAIRAGADPRQMADMLFAAVTDHRFIDIGHPADFTNKAFEALDASGWEYAEPVLASLVRGYAMADRMEEANAWRNPIDLVAILEHAFGGLAAAVAQGQERRTRGWHGRDELVAIVLADDPQATAEALLQALREGAAEEQLAGAVTCAAALRIARFHTSNEFGDWDTALHTFTFANAIQQGLRRAPSRDLLRGVFDAAVSVYLDRFLNVPPAPLPEADGAPADASVLLSELPPLLDRQQQVAEVGELVARYLDAGGEPGRLLAMLGHLLLREDRDFHTIQCVDAAFRQCELLQDDPARAHVLIAAARYLAAHAPTMRAQGQTYQIAWRLHRGDRLFEEG